MKRALTWVFLLAVLPVFLTGIGATSDEGGYNPSASVTLIHFMRDGDTMLSPDALVRKYPYARSREIVKKGWN